MIDISGLNKADVLAVLYNAASPHGLGFLQTAHAPAFMERQDAQKMISERGDDAAEHIRQLGVQIVRFDSGPLKFDYVYGRPIKADLSGDLLNEKYYDQYHGQGHALIAINELERTGQVMTDAIFALHSEDLKKEVAKVLERPEMFTNLEKEFGMGDFTDRLVALARRAMGGDN